MNKVTMARSWLVSQVLRNFGSSHKVLVLQDQGKIFLKHPVMRSPVVVIEGRKKVLNLVIINRKLTLETELSVFIIRKTCQKSSLSTYLGLL